MNTNIIVENTTLTDDTRQLFYNCINAINSNDSVKLEENISNLPLKQLSAKDSSMLINLLLDVCRENRNTFNTRRLAKIVVKEFKLRSYFELEDIKIYPSMFFDNYISLENLKYLSLIRETDTFMSVAEEITMRDWGDLTLSACMRLDETYPDQSLDAYKVLVELAYNLNNDTVLNYFMSNVKDKSPFAPVPKWISDKPIVYKDRVITNPTEADIKNVIRDIKYELSVTEANMKPSANMREDLINILLEQVKNNSYFSVNNSLDDVKDKLYQYYSHGRDDEIKNKYIEISRHNLYNDELLFRLLGPVNIPSNPTLQQLGVRDYRMLMNGQWDFDEDNERVDWFTGACDNDGLKIRKRCYAVRCPVIKGGWKGCFCSFPCLKAFVQKEECRKGTDLITRRMIDLIEKSINDIGIQERI